MTNKELAVQLYSSFLQAAAIINASPNLDLQRAKAIHLPTSDEMVATVKELTEKLASIEDK